MKVLVFGGHYFNYRDSVVYALGQLGHDVRVVEMQLLFNAKLNLIDYIRYKVGDSKYIDSFYGEVKKNLIDTLQSFKPDLFIGINGNTHYEFLDKRFFEETMNIGTITVAWYMDSIKQFANRPQNLQMFDKVYSFEPDDIAYCKEKLDVDIDYLPIGVGEEIYCKRDENIEQIYDVCFVGNATPNRLKVLNSVADYCYKNNKTMIVYGHYWHNKHLYQDILGKKKFAKKYPALSKYVSNELCKPTDVSRLYKQSKISLNIHTYIHKGINPRTFEILGNGNFELCDYRSDAEQFGLVDKHNIAFFTDADDCVKQIDWYLKNEVIRKVIGKRGKETIKDKYTMTELLGEVLK